MNPATQFEIEPLPTESHQAQPFNPDAVVLLDDGTPVSALDIGIAAIVICSWVFVAWKLPFKAGYRGLSRWAWFGVLVFLPISLWSFLSFVLVPWPGTKNQ